jgi:hypothetical protein
MIPGELRMSLYNYIIPNDLRSDKEKAARLIGGNFIHLK